MAAALRTVVCGDTGLLVELSGVAEVLDRCAQVAELDLEGVTDLVPAARTLLIRIDPRRTTLAAVEAALRQLEPPPPVAGRVADLEVPVHYGGPDLDEVGALTGLGPRGVVEAHTEQRWTVAFAGFAPGFGYLVGEDARLQVPRRPDPRPAVPVGAVALADGFSGIYPRRSPGGWQLIGTTELTVWDLGRDPPTLLQPGTVIRFVEAR